MVDVVNTQVFLALHCNSIPTFQQYTIATTIYDLGISSDDTTSFESTVYRSLCYHCYQSVSSYYLFNKPFSFKIEIYTGRL